MATVTFPEGKTVELDDPTAERIKAVHDYLYPPSSEPYRPTGASGESIAPQGSILRAVLPARENVPALIGGAAGDVVGKGFFGGPILSGLFAGGAEAAKQLGQRFLPESLSNKLFGGSTPPPTSTEAAVKIAAQMGIAGASSAGMRILGKLFSPFGEMTTPPMQEAIDTAREAGISPSASERTLSQFVQGTEKAAEASPSGGGITLVKQDNLAKLGQMAMQTADELGTARPLDTFGSVIKERLPAFKQTFQATKDELYAQADLKGIPASTEHFEKALEDTIKYRSGAFEPAKLDELKGLLEEIKRAKAKGISPDAEWLKNSRSNLGQQIGNAYNDPALTGIKSNLEVIQSAVDKDLTSTLEVNHPELLAKLKQADEFFSKGINSLKDATYKQLVKAKPSEIVDLLMKPDAPELVQAGREILGDSGMKDVTRQWFDQLLKDSMVQSKEGVTRVIDPKKLVENINRYGSSLDELFADQPKSLEALDRIRKVAGLLARNTGGSAESGGTLGRLLYEAVGSLIAPALKEDWAKSYITSGLPDVEKFIVRTGQPIMQNTLQNTLFKKKNEVPPK